MTPPLAFRNSCKLEISCDDQGRDCHLVISCDLAHRQTGELHTFERVIDLQPIVETVKRALENHRVSDVASGNLFSDLQKKLRDAKRGSSRKGGGAEGSIAVTPTGQTGTRTAAPAPREVFKTPEMLQAEDDARQLAQDEIDYKRQLAAEDRQLAQQDRDDARQQALDDREYARQLKEDERQAKLDEQADQYAASHPEQYQEEQSQYDDYAGVNVTNLSRRIAAAKGVRELWEDAKPLVVGGWTDDLGNAMTKYKDYVKQGAGLAAGYVGGPVAKKLAETAVDAAYGDDQAKVVMARATAIAHKTGSPAQINTVNIAKQAAKQQTVVVAASAASAGDPQAKAFVDQIHRTAKDNPDDSSAQDASRMASGVVSDSNGYSSAIQLMARG